MTSVLLNNLDIFNYVIYIYILKKNRNFNFDFNAIKFIRWDWVQIFVELIVV